MASPEVCLPTEEKMVTEESKLNFDTHETEDEKMETEIIDSKAAALSKKEEGNKFYTSKEYFKAIEYYTEAINLDSDCAAYYGNRAAAYMMVEQFSKALDDARKACSLDSSFVKAYHRAAKCYIATGQTSSALRTLDQAHNLEPKNKVITQELRNVHAMIDFESQAADAFDGKEYRKVEYLMRKLLEYAPSCLSYKSFQAECLALSGRYNDAQLLSNEILQKDSLHVESLYVRGLCLYYQDQTERAYKVLQQVLKIAPDFKKAREAYKKAKSLENSKEAGNNAFRAQNLEEAHKLYTEALTIDPLNKSTNSKIYCNRGTVNFKLKKFDDCISDCTEAIELDPTYLKAYLRRAKCYMDTEQYEEAVRDYDKINKMAHNHEYRRLLKDAKLELKKSKRKDYYKILGVSKTADDVGLKKAYRKEALKHHPDRHSSADEKTRKLEEIKFKDVNEAYSVLSDKVKRQRYDNGQDLDGGGFDFGGDFDPNIIFQSFFGGGGGGGFSQNYSQQRGGGGGFTFTFG